MTTDYQRRKEDRRIYLERFEAALKKQGLKPRAIEVRMIDARAAPLKLLGVFVTRAESPPKPGRPRLPGRFQTPIHLTPEHAERLARWMLSNDIKSKSAAVRELIERHCK